MKSPKYMAPAGVSAVTPLVAALSVIALPALAQDLVLEEVVVTAQKRAQSLQDVPISVSAVAGEKMQDAGIMNLGDLTAYVPNFTKSDTSIGQILSIRGISSGVNGGFEQSVVQYVDDIAMTRGAMSRMPFLDLERVEILRGPQNVLFGKNSIAGAISSTTAKPTDELEGLVFVQYQDEDEAKEIQGMISGPLTDWLRGRLAYRGFENDGFHTNNLTGEDDGGREEHTLRLILAADLSENIDATLKLERSEFDFDGRGDELFAGYTNEAGLGYVDVGNAVLNPAGWGSDDGKGNFKRNTNVDEWNDNTSNNVTFTLNWGLSSGIEMTAVTGYLDFDYDSLIDTDGSGFNFLNNNNKEDFEQFSQEIRFVSPGGETIDWIAGLYYQNWDLDLDGITFLEENGRGAGLAALGAGAVLGYENTKIFTSESDTYAVFAQATWNVTDAVRLTLGGRYTVEEKDASRRLDLVNNETGTINPGFGPSGAPNDDLAALITGRIAFGQDYESLGLLDQQLGGALSASLGVPLLTHNLQEDRDEDFFTPTIIAEWDVTFDTMLYANVSRGYKAGGFDYQGALGDPGSFEYEEESLDSFEVGFKTNFADGAAELSGAVFFNKYDDLQVSVFDGFVSFVVDNAAEAEAWGVEMDGRWRATEALTLSGSVGYLDFEFQDWPEAKCAAGRILAGNTNPDGSTCDYSGRSNIFSPELSAALSADYFVPITSGWDFRATLDVNYLDEQDVEPSLDKLVEQDARTMVNLRLAFENENWSLAVLGKNLTDEDGYDFITETPLSANVSNAILGGPYAAYTGYQQAPRTVAIQASYQF